MFCWGAGDKSVDEGEEGQRGLYSLKQAVDEGGEGQRGLYSLKQAVDEGGETNGGCTPENKLWMRAGGQMGAVLPKTSCG